MYISRLVKTRDPYPGLLQFAIQSCVPFLSSLPLLVIIFLFFFFCFQLFSLALDLVEVLSCPFHSKGT
jgi:ABC-type amino acid transport system permease subunit